MTTPTPDLFSALADLVAERVVAKLEPVLEELRAPAAEPWRLWSVADVSERLGRHRSSVFRLVREGLPHIRLDDGSLRFDPDDVREWCQQRRIPERQMTADRSQNPETPLTIREPSVQRITSPTKSGSARR